MSWKALLLLLLLLYTLTIMLLLMNINNIICSKPHMVLWLQILSKELKTLIKQTITYIHD